MQPISREDLLSYRFLSGVTASPYEDKAVFTVAVQDPKNNTYKKNLYCVDLATEKVEKLTSHGKAGAFLFAGPDLLLCQKKSDNPYHTDYEYFHLSDGSTQPAFTIPYPVNRLEKLSDTLYLVNADVDLNRDETMTEAELKAEADYIKIGELPFWDNGVGYVSGHRVPCSSITAPMAASSPSPKNTCQWAVWPYLATDRASISPATITPRPSTTNLACTTSAFRSRSSRRWSRRTPCALDS